MKNYKKKTTDSDAGGKIENVTVKSYDFFHQTRMPFLEILVKEIKLWYTFAMTDILVVPQSDAADFPQQK